MPPRLKAELWVSAHIRRCFAADIPAFLRRRGDADAGTVLLKINRFDAGCTVLEPSVDLSGNRAWLRATGPAPVEDAKAEEVIAKRLRTDPDVWVLEIEDRDGRHQLDEPEL